MFHLKSAPPSAPLLEAVRRLEGAGLVAALGGSGLLGALGLATEAHDWDLTTDSAPEDVAACFAGSEIERFGSSNPRLFDATATAYRVLARDGLVGEGNVGGTGLPSPRR